MSFTLIFDHNVGLFVTDWRKIKCWLNGKINIIFMKKIGKVCKQICQIWYICDISVTNRTITGQSGIRFFDNSVTNMWGYLANRHLRLTARKCPLQLCLIWLPCKCYGLFSLKCTDRFYSLVLYTDVEINVD